MRVAKPVPIAQVPMSRRTLVRMMGAIAAGETLMPIQPITTRAVLRQKAIEEHGRRLVASEHLFAAVSSIEGAHWHSSDELQSLARLQIDPKRSFHGSLRLASCKLLLDSVPSSFRQIEKMLNMTGRPGWEQSAHELMGVMQQFFAEPTMRDFPGLIWVQPVYISTSHGMRLWQIAPRDTHLSDPAPARRFGPRGLVRLPLDKDALYWIDLDASNIVFAHPDAKAANPRLVTTYRSRSGELPNGAKLDSAFERNFGIASRDDLHLVRQGYFPGHARFFRGVEYKRPLWIDFAVVTLARVVPVSLGKRRTESYCDVHQLVISIEPDLGRIVDINPVHRPYELFLQHYVGLNLTLSAAAGVNVA